MELFSESDRLNIATYLTEYYGPVGAETYFNFTGSATSDEERKIAMIDFIRTFGKQSTEHRLKLSELRKEA